MNAHNNTAQEAVQAALCQMEAEMPIDLHSVYTRNAACGYTSTLTFSPCEAQSVAARLRGISAISALMIATNDGEQFQLGEWMRGGLIEALHALASDAESTLEAANSRTQDAKEAA